jgi:plasmid rolling circle replication initiator protein Rep
MWVARFLKAMPKYRADYPKLVPIALTLTVRNCPVDELRATVGEMNLAFKRMSQRRAWPGVGWVKSLEVTRSKTREAHPHFHCMLFVKPSYFSGPNYIKHERWCELWRDCLRVDYLPEVRVQRAKSKKPGGGDDAIGAVGGGIVETLKYSVKSEELVSDGDWLYAITEQLHNTRAVAVGGNLRGYLKDEEPEDLINTDEPELDVESDEGTIKLIFDWASEVKRYAKKLDN